MAKRNKKAKRMGLVLMAIGLILLIVPSLLAYNSDNPLASTNKKEVVCEVTVTNQILKNLEITNIKCSSEKKFLCANIPFIGQGILSDSGTLRFSAGGKSKTEEITVTETQSKTKIVGLCIPSSINSGFVSIINENNELTDSKGVSF